MNLQKLLNNMMEIIVEYCTSQLKSTPARNYSAEDLKKLIEELNQVNALRVPMLNYFLSTVNTIQGLIHSERLLELEDYYQMASLLTDLVSNCQLLMKIPTNALTELTIKEAMYGLQTWSLYSGYIPCNSGTLIVNKLFQPLKLTQDSDFETIRKAINRLIEKFQQSIRLGVLEAENVKLRQEIQAAKTTIAQLYQENLSIQSKLGQTSTDLVTIPLTPPLSPVYIAEPDIEEPGYMEPNLADSVFSFERDNTEMKAQRPPFEARTPLESKKNNPEEDEPTYHLVPSMPRINLNCKSNHVQKSIFATKDLLPALGTTANPLSATSPPPSPLDRLSSGSVLSSK